MLILSGLWAGEQLVRDKAAPKYLWKRRAISVSVESWQVHALVVDFESQMLRHDSDLRPCSLMRRQQFYHESLYAFAAFTKVCSHTTRPHFVCRDFITHVASSRGSISTAGSDGQTSILSGHNSSTLFSPPPAWKSRGVPFILTHESCVHLLVFSQ